MVISLSSILVYFALMSPVQMCIADQTCFGINLKVIFIRFLKNIYPPKLAEEALGSQKTVKTVKFKGIPFT